MILLKKCLLNKSNLYNFGAIDGPSRGSERDIFKNVSEMTNMLDSFEHVSTDTRKKLTYYNLEIDDVVANEILRPFHQQLRHGLAFDWVMNYCMKQILDKLPKGSPYVEFKGTTKFIQQFNNDVVFNLELHNLTTELNKIFQWVVGEDNKISDLSSLVETNDDVRKRSHYLVFLLQMLADSIGPAELLHWTEHFDKMIHNHPETDGDVLVVGGHARVFAFGDIDGTGNKWHKLPNGITMSGTYRIQRKDYTRSFPDEMTFVRFEDGAMVIDETFFPTISIDNGPFINAIEFGEKGLSCTLDQPHTLTIAYKFEQDINNPKQIKLRAGENCIIKDPIVTLDKDGKATTQILFRGNSATFKIADPDKKYPFGIFTTKNIQSDIDTFAWL